MPHGSAPGERRGGRQKGTPNKATAARRADVQTALTTAFAALGPEYIDQLSPAMLQLIAMREAAKAGHIQAALAIAKEAAPYFDAKATAAGSGKDDGAIVEVRGRLPGPDQDAD